MVSLSRTMPGALPVSEPLRVYFGQPGYVDPNPPTVDSQPLPVTVPFALGGK